jgi:hypothetical protein
MEETLGLVLVGVFILWPMWVLLGLWWYARRTGRRAAPLMWGWGAIVFYISAAANLVSGRPGDWFTVLVSLLIAVGCTVKWHRTRRVVRSADQRPPR